MLPLRTFCLFLLLLPALAFARWVPDHTVIVILENKSFQEFIGNPQAPYLNRLAEQGALMTNAYFAASPYGVTPSGFKHPLPARGSQVNYLYLFSGNDQGLRPDWFLQPGSPYRGPVTHDRYGERLPDAVADAPRGLSNGLVPAAMRPFATPNLGAALRAAGRSYATFSEALPHPGFDAAVNNPPGAEDGYARRHNPGINWIDFGLPGMARVPAERRRFLLPPASNLGFANTATPDGRRYRGFAVDAAGRPLDYARLPTLAIVVPSNDDNAHTGSIAAADRWLETHIEPYARWARTHNSLLIVQTDEDGFTDLGNGSGPFDEKYSAMAGGRPLGYQYGIDRILTLFVGPPGRVVPGRYGERIDHLNVLATVLHRYGALAAFRRDFARIHVDAQRDARLAAEARNEYENLRPIIDIFGEGLPLPELPKHPSDTP